MTLLSDMQIIQFQKNGYICPIPALPVEETRTLRANLEAFEATQGGRLKPPQRNKSHLLFKWVDDLIRDPRVLHRGSASRSPVPRPMLAYIFVRRAFRC